VRNTEDADFFVEPTIENIERLNAHSVRQAFELSED
jgi:hypothetical protein